MSEISVDELGNGENELPVTFTEPGISPIRGIQGEFGARDIKYPYFSIIQSVGPNYAEHPQHAGGLLYDKKTIVEKPVELVFYGLRKQYAQNLSYDPAGPRAQVYGSVAEVLAGGGNVREYVGAGQDENNYVPQAIAFIGLFAPKGKKSWASGLDLALINGDKVIVPAVWIIAKTAYRTVIPLLIKAEIGLAREKKEMAHARWNLNTVHTKIGSNFIFTPALSRVDGFNSEETLALLAENFGK